MDVNCNGHNHSRHHIAKPLLLSAPQIIDLSLKLVDGLLSQFLGVTYFVNYKLKM